MAYIIYNNYDFPEEYERGRITLNCECSEDDLVLLVGKNQSFIEGDKTAATHYINEQGSPQIKGFHSASFSDLVVDADGESEIVLSTLPIPCKLIINGDIVIVDDGSLEFSSSVQGPFRVSCDHPHYYYKDWLIHAV